MNILNYLIGGNINSKYVVIGIGTLVVCAIGKNNYLKNLNYYKSHYYHGEKDDINKKKARSISSKWLIFCLFAIPLNTIWSLWNYKNNVQCKYLIPLSIAINFCVTADNWINGVPTSKYDRTAMLLVVEFTLSSFVVLFGYLFFHQNTNSEKISMG
eukprot:219047_1